MLDTITILVLFVLLLVTLELRQRSTTEVKRLKALEAANAELYRLALEAQQRDIKAYRTMLADARHAAKVTNEALARVCLTANEDNAMHKARIDNLCEQLEESRKGRRFYFDQADKYAKEVRTLSCELAESRLAAFANLSDMTRLSALQQENKLDALCEVIKTLMNRDQLDDAAVASFGGRLSRAVQVYRKDRLKAIAEEHMTELGPTPCLIPGLSHLMETCMPRESFTGAGGQGL